MKKRKESSLSAGVLTNGARPVFLGSGANLASRAFVTKKNKIDATQGTTQKTVSLGTTGSQLSDFSTTGFQVRDLIQALIRLRGPESTSQKKRQTGKHRHDDLIKGLNQSIDLLKNLLLYGYNPERIRILFEALMENITAKARKASASLGAGDPSKGKSSAADTPSESSRSQPEKSGENRNYSMLGVNYNRTLARFTALADQNSPEGQKLQTSLASQREKIDESGAYSWEGENPVYHKVAARR